MAGSVFGSFGTPFATQGISPYQTQGISPYQLTGSYSPVAALPQVVQLLQIVPGPDFPTAGIIHGPLGIHQAYKTGHGSLMMRARTEVEQIQRSER